jgi:hypothetical protein
MDGHRVISDFTYIAPTSQTMENPHTKFSTADFFYPQSGIKNLYNYSNRMVCHVTIDSKNSLKTQIEPVGLCDDGVLDAQLCDNAGASI